MRFRFTKKEIKELAYSALALGIIFAYPSFNIVTVIAIILIVALSFIPHELAHKYMAMKYGSYAQYEMWTKGLLFALLLAIISGGSIVFAAPGAVMIYAQRHISIKENGLISAAGPAMNLILALMFLPFAGMNVLTYNIVYINAFLAMFNMLPVSPLDGSKIFRWNAVLWGVMIAASIIIQWIL